ncbi:MAG TPA: head GIN domain-containing protein [Ramlibacter sp.]|nr:head GIN domain-containing protein [Ramlibacter sp.]
MKSFPHTLSHHLFALPLALVLSFASMSVFAAPWFGSETVKGNGVVKQQTRTVGAFSAIELSLPAQVELRMGSIESVTVEADENILPLIETSTERGALQLRASKRNLRFDARTLKIVVNAKEIRQLSIGGSGSINAAVLKAPKLELEIGGAGSMELKQLESETVETSIGGSGNVKLAGAVRKLSIAIGGSGDVDAPQLKADEASVSIGGSGKATLWSVNSLKASIAGSGDVHYYGDPKTSVSVVGSGGIKRLGASPK